MTYLLERLSEGFKINLNTVVLNNGAFIQLISLVHVHGIRIRGLHEIIDGKLVKRVRRIRQRDVDILKLASSQKGIAAGGVALDLSFQCIYVLECSFNVLAALLKLPSLLSEDFS
jgi:hypothetical protein